MISCQSDVSSLVILYLDKWNKNNKCALSPDFIYLVEFYTAKEWNENSMVDEFTLLLEDSA